MIRLILTISILISVLSIGVPFDNPIDDFVFKHLRIFGIDVSMTPLTSDMSIMTDLNKFPIYKSNLRLKIFFKNGKNLDVLPRKLDLYYHKLPLILYYEILGYGGVMPEGKTFLCRSFESLLNEKITGFFLWIEKEHVRYGFNQIQECR